MAISRGRSFQRTAGRKRRRTSWELGPKSDAAGAPQTITGSSAQVGGLVGVVGLDGTTWGRIRGQFMAHLLTSGAVNNGYHGAFGIAVATSAAVTAGVASLPTPITEEAWDGWLYHHYFQIHSSGAITAAGAATQIVGPDSIAAAVRVEVDSKVMRKLEIDQTIYCAVEVSEVGTATMEWFFNSRALLLLP